MMRRHSGSNNFLLRTVIFSLIILFCSTAISFASDPAAIGRYALIIGKNNGGNDRVVLKYAATDASSISLVLNEMGGLLPSRQVLLLNPSVDDINKGFTKISEIIENEKGNVRRSEFIIYYSGHSDETGLLIENSVLLYKKLRDQIKTVPADVHIAIIDSCASGVFIRTKGGTKQPPFLIDSSTEMTGYAFLSSSSENEAAQESDRLGASFFTHYLISGLRGGADATQDSVVTLNEAYHYAFKETLAKTEKTQYGPQHPSYDIQLTGTGDLILTDLRVTTSSMIFAENMNGRIYIRNPRGDLVLELLKQQGTPMKIGLTPGKYLILLETDNKLLESSVTLTRGTHTRVSLSDMTNIDGEITVARGSRENGLNITTPEDLSFTPFSFTLIPDKIQEPFATSISLNLTIGQSHRVTGFMFSTVGSSIQENLTGANVALIYTTIYGDMKGATFSSIFNIIHGDAAFLSVAGIFNSANGSVRGAQIASIFNTAGKDVFGSQIALYNQAQDVTGAQIGLVNTGKNVCGVQIGLINISEDITGASLGLVTISKTGILNFEAGYGTDTMNYLAFKTGSKYFYTIFMGGYDIFTDTNRWMYGAGIGGHFPLSLFFFDAELLITSINTVGQAGTVSFEKTLLPRFRAKAGITFGDFFGIFAGVDFQFHHPQMYFTSTSAEKALVEFPVLSGDICSIVPEFFVGIQLLN